MRGGSILKADQDKLSKEDNIKAWEEARKTVESLEATIESTRRLFLSSIGLIAAGIGAMLSYFQEGPLQSGVSLTFMYLLAVIVIGLSLIFWGLDNRYRQYLRISAAVSREIEDNLVDDERQGVSLELEKFNKKRRLPGSWVYHFVYFLPAAGAVLAIAYIEAQGGRLFNLEHNGNFWLIFYGILVGTSTLLIAISDRFCRSYIENRFDSEN